MKRNVILLIGTIKGLFIASADEERQNWQLSGPHFSGRQIYAVAFDPKKSRIWTSATSMHWGAELFSSDDFGATWAMPEQPLVQFPADTGESLKNIWQIAPSPHKENTIFCGAEPACLFVSHDNGATFQPVDGFYTHPHRKEWMPGNGGLCLHTIIHDKEDPHLMWTAVSTGGVYKTTDGGLSWQPKNKGIRAPFYPDPYPEYGQCVHKMVQHPAHSNVLYLQHHWGVYRSDDYGESWQNIGQTLPSDFGFAMAVAPVEPFAVYVIPLKSDEFRCVPDGKLAVYRSTGTTEWECLDEGLPAENCFETVLRDGLTVDPLEPTGIYFGTRNGKVWGSARDGRDWRLLFDSLPSVLNIKAYAF